MEMDVCEDMHALIQQDCADAFPFLTALSANLDRAAYLCILQCTEREAAVQCYYAT